MDIEKVLGSVYPLTKTIVLEMHTVGTFVAVLEALSNYGDKLLDEGKHTNAGMELKMMCLDLVDEAQMNGWNCGDPDCQDCSEKPPVGDGLKEARVFEIPPYDAGEA